ncbi:MAG TPA: TonB-dependent receptor [Alphaproteobacteria bacterium]|nr:TonB-dependent receptor [Alphaproteobacteria bacterium]
MLASTVIGTAPILAPIALAQDQPSAAPAGQIEEIVVTAQKRAENMQTVPVSIQAFSGKKLEQMNATEFADYAKFLPSVVYQTLAPNQTTVYMRGIATAGGQDGNHSASQPLVGIYFDEQPTTTILGQLDIHLYDIQRIEALAGPQGTLFGASSEAGTLRIITNKPDPTKFSGSFDTQLDTTRGDLGHINEGYVNIPLSDRVAIRIVAFEEGDPGYIDNVHGTRTYLGAPGVKLDNANMVQDNFNGVQSYGGRAALGVNLDDDWTVTTQLMGQELRSTGVFGFNPRHGDLNVTQYYPDNTQDSWAQAALTIQGKIGDFDLTYAGGYFDRGQQTQGDYSDYTAAYTNAYAQAGINFPAYFTDNNGKQVNPSQRIIGRDHFTKLTQELRIASPTEDRFRFVAGLFFERQGHKIHQDYKIDGIGSDISVPNFPGTIWLTQEMRFDRDLAAFGQATYDIDDHWSVTGGVRVFETRNSIYGFYGFGAGFSSHTGEAGCFIPGNFEDAPCSNLDKTVEEVNATFKANLQYKFDAERMVYATVSSGYRPGGINRYGSLPPYSSDMLYNYEIGWKTSWNDGEIRWNGAMFWENWDNFQFSFLGPNSLTQIANAGAATVRGLETDVTWAVTPNFTVSGAGSFINSELTKSVCSTIADPNAADQTCKGGFSTLAGTPLPVTPPVSFNVTARYEADISDSMTGFVQGSTVFEGRRTSDLRANGPRDQIGPMPAYVTFDLSAGVTRDETSASIFFKNLFDSRGEVYRYVECGASCLAHPNVYVVPVQPFTFGVKLGQKF